MSYPRNVRRQPQKKPAVKIGSLKRKLSSLAPTQEAKPVCIIGKYCEFHNYVHGAEAEELRSRLEQFIKQMMAEIPEDLDPEDLANRLEKLLDDVDARDTADFVQIKPRLGSTGAWRSQNEHAVRRRPQRKTKR